MHQVSVPLLSLSLSLNLKLFWLDSRRSSLFAGAFCRRLYCSLSSLFFFISSLAFFSLFSFRQLQVFKRWNRFFFLFEDLWLVQKPNDLENLFDSYLINFFFFFLFSFCCCYSLRRSCSLFSQASSWTELTSDPTSYSISINNVVVGLTPIQFSDSP